MDRRGLYAKATIFTGRPLVPPPWAVLPAPGCQYDTQCKGDRICIGGAYVAPAMPADASAPAASDAGM